MQHPGCSVFQSHLTQATSGVFSRRAAYTADISLLSTGLPSLFFLAADCLRSSSWTPKCPHTESSHVATAPSWWILVSCILLPGWNAVTSPRLPDSMKTVWVNAITWGRISPFLLKKSHNTGQVTENRCLDGNDYGNNQHIEHLPDILILSWNMILL